MSGCGLCSRGAATDVSPRVQRVFEQTPGGVNGSDCPRRSPGVAVFDRRTRGLTSVALSEGDTLLVLGPNGAGKTTLLRVLATLLRPTAGTVRVLGCDLPAEAWKLRPVRVLTGHLWEAA